MLTDTSCCAPAASAPTFAVPTAVPFRVSATVVAAEPAVPVLRAVPVTVMASVGVGLAGDVPVRLTCRSAVVGSGPEETTTEPEAALLVSLDSATVFAGSTVTVSG